MSTELIIPGGPTKRAIIDLAFDDCGSSNHIFERTPEEYGQALRKLNAMMLEWPYDQLGYIQPDYADGDTQDGTGIDRKHTQAVATGLALRIAPGIGKTLSPEYRAAATRAHAILCATVHVPQNAAFPSGTPRGSGRRWQQHYNYPFINEDGPTADPELDPGNLAGIVTGG